MLRASEIQTCALSDRAPSVQQGGAVAIPRLPNLRPRCDGLLPEAQPREVVLPFHRCHATKGVIQSLSPILHVVTPSLREAT